MATLDKDVFGLTVENHELVKLAYDAYLANSRSSHAKTLKRGEVRGGGKKPWKQKGTGRARFGSTRNPIWRHGGVAFGPQPRSYATKMNKKERRLALKSALSYKVSNKELIVLDSLNIETNKTKDMKAILENLKVNRNILIVVDELNDNLVLATRNLDNVFLITSEEINTLDVVSANVLIATEGAVKAVEEALA